MPIINLDYASHTPADERVLLEFCRAARQFPANPLAAHQMGRAAMDELNRVTAGMAGLLGFGSHQLIYTSGASEANNLAIKGIARAYKHVGRHILSTCLEHPSVSGTLSALQAEGNEIGLVKILPNGKIDLDALNAAIRPDTVLLCVSAVDSELGVIQPIVDIVDVLATHPHCHLHVDVAQAVGKLPIHIDGASTLSFSAHKFHGVCGVGGLFKSDGVVLEPLIHGGASANIYRSGTPALALAASCYKALEIAMSERDENLAKVRKLREHVLCALKNYPAVRINSPADASPYILNLSVDGIKGNAFRDALDKHGVAVSVKSACSTDNAPSRAVMAVTADSNMRKKNALLSWRISFSHLTTIDERDGFLEAFDSIAKINW